MPDGTPETIARIGAARVVPIATLDTADQAAPLARALLAGGLTVVEVTFRSEAGAESIRIIRERFPDMLVGAGTVLNVEQVGLAHRAGSHFILTPGFNPAVVGAALEAGVPIFPGVNDPTGVEQAMGFGLEAVKFFPAEASGGVPFIEALVRSLRRHAVRPHRRHRPGQSRGLPGASQRSCLRRVLDRGSRARARRPVR